MSVLGDAAQLCDRDAVLLVVLACCLCGLVSRGGCAGEVFLPGVGVEMCSGAALSVAHGLRFVVGRKHVWLVLAPERSGLLGRRVEQAGALADRVSGGIRHERQLAAGPTVGYDVAAVDVAA